MIGTHLRSRQKACVHSWPFRCYLRYLVDTTGYPWRAVTIAMDVPSDQFEKIIRCGPGQYFLTPSLARRILEFTPESLLKLGSEPASTQEIRALYSELRALGVSHLELACHCKLNVRELSALMLGKRNDFGKAMFPSSVTLTVLGASMLWFGWFGFNAGSGLAAGVLVAFGRQFSQVWLCLDGGSRLHRDASSRSLTPIAWGSTPCALHCASSPPRGASPMSRRS